MAVMAKAFNVSGGPWKGWTASTGLTSAPAAPVMPMQSAKTITYTLETSMPTMRAASRFWAAARIPFPSRVRDSRTLRPPSTPRATIRIQNFVTGTVRESVTRQLPSSAVSARRKSAEKISFMAF